VSRHTRAREDITGGATDRAAPQSRRKDLRALPSVDELAREPLVQDYTAEVGTVSHAALIRVVRQAIDEARAEIQRGCYAPTSVALAERVRALLGEAQQPRLRQVINATGVIVNTNLGRAPLSRAALMAMEQAARGYSNLEFDLAGGERGSRQALVSGLIREVTGAEDALAVNNNAAAVLVVLAALAAGREVIVSRGELVEIGGGFRVPDVMRQSGARLVEVGTTNRTRVEDYATALSDQTALLLAVHPSNFRIVGFTEAPALDELAALAHAHGLPMAHDVGSGCLYRTERWGLAHEPTPQESIAAGADVVCFSGDKLLGGPQAGIIAGRQTVLAQVARHPLMRAVRIDKLTLAALEATLRQHRDGVAEWEIPVWQAIAAPLSELQERAERWVMALREAGIQACVVRGESTVGGGSLPGEMLPTALCAIGATKASETDVKDGGRTGAATLDTGTLAARLRRGALPVVARVAQGQLLLDPRTVLPGEDEALIEAVHKAALVD
jgi:L-seryl-tRNA(Ser) seleniumtransferase